MSALLLLLSLTAASPEAVASGCQSVNGVWVCDDLKAAIATSGGVGASIKAKVSDPLTVLQGQVTFDSEGNDNPKSRYFSRKLHWPGGASGVTIGRGYDMKFRTEAEIKADLIKAGVSAETAAELAEGAGLKGADAKKFAKDNKALVLTQAEQKALFEQVYEEYEADTRRLVCKWAGESGAACDALWSGMDGSIQQMLIDLRYRGDLTKKRWKKWLSKPATANNLRAFAKVMGSSRKWSKVPDDRFNRRKAFMDAAVVAATPVPRPRPNPRRLRRRFGPQ